MGQDENRHGDIFNALLRSQKSMWNTWKGRLWSRFFLLTVFATHTLTVHERADFYRSVGLNPQEFDRHVTRKTNETAARSFPEVLDVDHPDFFPGLERCVDRNQKMQEIDGGKGPKWLKGLRKLPLKARIFADLVRLYFIKPVDAESLRNTVR